MSMSFKTIIFWACFAVVAFPAMAEIEWLSTRYEYGAFKEAEGQRKGSLQFVNKGPEATFINGVRPSCGCTGATYTEDMIQPGDTATVSFVYNPAGRPGPFDKTVRVYIGKENELHVLRISGTVIGAPSTLENSYPVEVGSMRIQTLSHKGGEIRKGESRHMFINVYNQGSDTITPVWTGHNAPLEVKLTPEKLAPGEIGTLGFYLRTSKEEMMGPVEYKVHIRPDVASPSEDEREITVGAVIVPDTRKMSVEEIDNGGRAYIVPEFVDFGEVGSSKPLKFEFEVLNDGRGPLAVSRVYSLEKGVEINKTPKVIKPGKRGKIKGTLDIGSLHSGAFRLHVEVMTDDAIHPVRTANLVGIKE